MSIDQIKGQTEKELRGRLNELNGEIFKSRFSTEVANPRKGAEIRKRRREIARIHTLLQGRVALARRQEEVRQLELKLSGLGKAHEGTQEHKRRRSMVAGQLEVARRAVRELTGESAPKAAKPAVAKSVDAAPAEKVAKPAAEKAAKPAKEKAEKPKAEKPAKKEAKAETKPKAKKKADK
ncbi:MAG: 50S ribosomal protein L29 [Planctomycetes bacterium]|nr:50S ribosomal protein L29 [Planctomycetota bacterium]